MKRLLEDSPARGYRWLFTFLGALISVAIVVGTVGAFDQMTAKDMPILLVPGALLLGAVWMIYIGLLADDERVLRISALFARWGR